MVIDCTGNCFEVEGGNWEWGDERGSFWGGEGEWDEMGKTDITRDIFEDVEVGSGPRERGGGKEVLN